MASKTPKSKQVMDVSRPGASASSPTSRPIIVSNRPVLTDPMVVEQTTETKAQTTSETSVSSSKIKIQPLHDDVKADTDAADNKAAADGLIDAPILPVEEVDEPAADEAESAQPEKSAEPELEPATEAPEPETATDVEADGVTEPGVAEAKDSLPDDGEDLSAKADADHDTQLADLGKPDPEAVKAAREAAEKQLAFDKLVAEETYFLPIDRAGKRRARRLFITIGTIVFVLLALVALDMLLETGVLTLGSFKPPSIFVHSS